MEWCCVCVCVCVCMCDVHMSVFRDFKERSGLETQCVCVCVCVYMFMLKCVGIQSRCIGCVWLLLYMYLCTWGQGPSFCFLGHTLSYLFLCVCMCVCVFVCLSVCLSMCI